MKKKSNVIRKAAYICILVLLVLSVVITNTVTATDEVVVTAEHECPVLLRKGDVKIGTAFATADINGKKYPAYCLDVTKQGVGEGVQSYKVAVGDTIENQEVYRTIINGYPYVTPKDLGVETKEEAFTATKQAVYTVIYGRDISEYAPVDDSVEAKRTYDAYVRIVEKARSSNETYDEGTLKIQELSDWEVYDNKYLRKKIKIESNKQGEVDISISSKLDTLKITDLDGKEKDKFKCDEELYLQVGITELKESGTIAITATGKLVTNPILYSKPESDKNQDYAISGMKVSGNIQTKLEVKYKKNDTKIRLLKVDGDTKEPLDDVEFMLLDENKNEIAKYVTDENGEIVFEDLTPGKYFLLETKTKVGYTKANEPIELSVDYNEDIQITVDNSKIPKVEKTAKRLEVKRLPKTGF